MIRALIFDCFGVLYQGSLEYLMELCPTKRRQELRDLSRAFDYGYVSEGEYLEQASAILEKDEAEIVRIIEERHVKNEEMLVRRLKGKYKTALLSNIGGRVLPQLFSEKELEELFDVVVLSSDEGFAKPDAPIFRIAAERLNVPVGECVMIDDSRTNCAGAVTAGMCSLLYEDREQCLSELKKIGVM